MATSLEQLKITFFDECSEQLELMEAGLTEMRDGAASDDTINAVFRAVHSVKGGAGIFGFEGLVGFAHVFETVLDAMRAGKLPATAEVVDTLLPASDVLSDLVTMSRGGQAIPPDYGHECRAALERLMGGGSSEGDDDNSPAPAEFDGLDFVPVRFDELDAPAESAPADTAPIDSLNTFAITFRPHRDMLQKANEPLYVLRELRKLGELALVADSSALPLLSEIEPDYPYVAWSGTLRTAATRAQVDEVFEFVVGDCDLSIEEEVQAPAATPAPVAAAPAPVVLADATPVASPVLLAAPTLAELPVIAAPSLDQAAVPVAAFKPPPAIAETPPPPRVEPAETADAKPAKQAATTTRVELEKIDRVVNLVGELVIAQAMLGQIVHGLPESVSGQLMQIMDEVAHHTRELKDSVMSMRAQPVGAVFQRMPRLVRELSAKTSKKVRLEMVGENTEVDRSMIERLGDPLTHIIRNSVDHGIESPQDRLAAGKNEEGTIRLAAEHRGGRIVIIISDDGGGINPERVLKKARERELVSPDAVLTEDEISNLVFLPGFSTAETISDISGRGVGMDVVRRNIQDVGGRISLKSDRGKGMTIQLALPLTLAVMDGMVIRVGRETYVVPMSAIVECLRPPRSDIRNLLDTRGMLQIRGDLIPLVHLADLLHVDVPADDSSERVVIVTEAADNSRVGLVVDELCGHQQVVVKSIEASYGQVPGIAGATILGNGRVAFILDVEKLSGIEEDGILSAANAGFATKSAPQMAS